MNSPLLRPSRRPYPPRRGFALVISLTLMVLLTTISVGLLALSSLTLRTSSREQDMAEARANARLALAMAINQLQKSAGPDQRITAPANLTSPSAHPSLTAVWESRKLSPEGDSDLADRKKSSATTPQADGEFLTWLNSSALLQQTASPSSPPPSPPSSALLLAATGPDTSDLRSAILPLTSSGGISWTTIDEGVKARFNLSSPSEPERANWLSSLRAPFRPSPEILPGLEPLAIPADQANKLISLRSGELTLPTPAPFTTHFPDLTPWSFSLATNVADGGLKADLTRAFEEAALPPALAGRYLYSSTKQPLAPSDPLFSNLAGYYKLHRTAYSNASPLPVSIPQDYTPVTNNQPRLAAVNGAVMAPVVTRVSVVFSLVSREAHGNWAAQVPSTTGDAQRRYMVYLIYTPVVMLYNPYDVPLNVNQVKVSFKHLPLAFQFFRNGASQTSQPSLLSQFHVSSENRNDWDDQFSVTLSNLPGNNANTSMTLAPGEARVFGINHPRGTLWDQMTNYLWQSDLNTSKTLNLSSGPGWNYRSGFIVDWLRPAISGRTADNSSLGVFGARGTDTIDVACSPEMPGGSNGQFSVDISARIGNRDTSIGTYRYTYGNRSKLIEALQSGVHASLGKVQYPFRREKPWQLNEIYQPNVGSTPIEDWIGPKPFAIFTLVDRTALDSIHPFIPVRHSSFNHQVLDMDVTRSHPAQMPMEMAFMPITGDGANVVGSIDAAADNTNRAFHFSGTRQLTGALNFPSSAIPLTPPANLATFRHAHLANSGHFPLVTHTVGESFAHPLLPADRALTTTSNFGYPLADPVWLSNHALWDSCYLSTLTHGDAASAFFTRRTALLNPRFTPAPFLSPSSAATQALSADAWISNASRQLITGGFNVNSTSVAAWRSLLASLRHADIPTLDPVSSTESRITAKGSPYPRFARSTAGSIDQTAPPDNQTRWSGFRELDDTEIDRLANAIVEQIRTRGPFLSMSEFVNRQLTSADNPAALSGPLESAITQSGVNEKHAGPLPRIITEDQLSSFDFAFPKAGTGNAEQGSPSFLSQGDLLEALGATLTVRSDTFVIRAYGESGKTRGQPTARARCEAVLQRLPQYVDPSDAPEKVQTLLDDPSRTQDSLNPVNQRFGRRFEVVSFRWLSPEEI